MVLKGDRVTWLVFLAAGAAGVAAILWLRATLTADGGQREAGYSKYPIPVESRGAAGSAPAWAPAFGERVRKPASHSGADGGDPEVFFPDVDGCPDRSGCATLGAWQSRATPAPDAEVSARRDFRRAPDVLGLAFPDLHPPELAALEDLASAMTQEDARAALGALSTADRGRFSSWIRDARGRHGSDAFESAPQLLLEEIGLGDPRAEVRAMALDLLAGALADAAGDLGLVASGSDGVEEMEQVRDLRTDLLATAARGALFDEHPDVRVQALESIADALVDNGKGVPASAYIDPEDLLALAVSDPVPELRRSALELLVEYYPEEAERAALDRPDEVDLVYREQGGW